MAQTPEFTARDGSTATELVYTTNRSLTTLEGTVDLNTVDLQISIDNGTFVSDPAMVLLDGTSFTIPNPASYPDGMTLNLGNNSIRIRAIDIVGSVSPTATASITRVETIENAETLIPTGIQVRRWRDAVDIMAAEPNLTYESRLVAFGEEPLQFGETIPGFGDGATGLGEPPMTAAYTFHGFNFYASTSPGGTTGYFQINSTLVTSASSEVTEETIPLMVAPRGQTEFTPTDITTDAGAYIRVRTTVHDSLGNELALVQDVTQAFYQDLSLGELGITANPVRLSHSIEEVRRTNNIYFRHNRQEALDAGVTNNDQFSDISGTEPLYYVVTGVLTDNFTGNEIETPYSQEVLGKPLTIDTRIQDLPRRSSLQATIDYVAAIQRVQNEISLVPGSTTRDVSIDPFASEAERLWFLIDFVHRSQSFLTLLPIDDANSDGVSDPVVSSAFKQALKAAVGFTTDAAVQTLIDQQFDKLAGNFQKTRLPGRPAVGQAVFYTTSAPSTNLTVASGTTVSTSGGIRFFVGGTYTLPAADAEAYYNFDTKRYEIIVDIVAEKAGANGNVSAGEIVNVQEGTSGFSVTNTESTVYGSDRETNVELAYRSQLALTAVDTGTEGGYASTAAEQIGIVKSKIVKSGDDLMMRDWDEVRQKHVGGKVDIWVQGLRERTVTERFAFTFETARDIRCQIIDVSTLTFRVLDSRVTVDTPIIELLDNASQGLGVRNSTLGKDYNLTGATLIDYETFQLDPLVQTFTTALDDVITADFRYRSVNQFTFNYQPVRRVISVVGDQSGPLSTTQGFDLYKTADPLLDGESTVAGDYLVINQVGGIPTGATLTVSDEAHVVIGFFDEPLQNIGINTATLRVFSEDRTIEYDGPGTTSPDYVVTEGGPTTPVKIRRTTTSAIVSGQTVVIDYEHDENFTVTYVINDLLQQLQQTINAQRHITADVLVKQAILNSVEIETTIQLLSGASKDSTDPRVRSSVSTELNQKTIGQGSAQSDIVNAIDSTDGVDFQVLPLAKMGYADGSRKLREDVSNSNLRVASLDIGNNRAFILTNAVKYPTTDGGGSSTEHKGVFQDDEAMTLSSALAGVALAANSAYIIGQTGAVITGYSDDATITAETGLTDPDDIEAERIDRTANRAVIALSGTGDPQDVPDNHTYRVSYVISGDIGPHDLTASQVEFLDLGDFTITFRTAS